MTKVVCLCVDGASARKHIREAVVEAFGWQGIGLQSGQLKYATSSSISLARYRAKIRDLFRSNGGASLAPGLLIVGKSLGGAKLYRLVFESMEILQDFARVAVVLVDPHEPGAPGDSGDTGHWYDYVHFSGGTHRLTWQAARWGDAQDQFGDEAVLRFYSTYQRNEWPRGYALTSPFKSVCLSNKKVHSNITGAREPADHWNISWCDKTVTLIGEAIAFLQHDGE